MIIQKFSVNQYPISTLLSWIQSGEVAVPEIQRPFVWESTQVRDFIDSLYKGYPVGYIIIWQNPNVKAKDGTSSKGKKILIDGQQRVTALMSAILGKEIVDKDYRKRKIRIAFNPKKKIFEVTNTAIEKNKEWISDISKVFSQDFNFLKLVEDYVLSNPDVIKDDIFLSLDALRSIVNVPVGVIELNSDLDLEEVTEIFIRMNSKGTQLNQSDFAMSKFAVNDKYGGDIIRKAIDYFCYLADKPEFYHEILENDKEFANTDYFKKMAWLKESKEDLYDPSYVDLLRTIFTYKFKRGKLQDLVALLSGRDFKTKEYKEEIIEDTINKFREGLFDYINEANFKKFIMIIRSAGFIDSSMIRAYNPLNFSYALFLTLKEKGIHPAKIESYVRKWFVMSVLTSRYSGSPDSQFDEDIKRLEESNPEEFINNIFKAELSDSFWSVTLPESMITSSDYPYFQVFLAAQVKMKDKGFLSKDITVEDLISIKGDVHHIFPKDYLKKSGFSDRKDYNQIANYVMAQSEINLAIGNKPPKEYIKELISQCNTKNLKYGGINNLDDLVENFKMHCIPITILENNDIDYLNFLQERRKLMAQKIRKYFEML